MLVYPAASLKRPSLNSQKSGPTLPKHRTANGKSQKAENEQEMIDEKPGTAKSNSGIIVPEISLLGEFRTIQPIQNSIKDDFAPYAIHIYGPVP